MARLLLCGNGWTQRWQIAAGEEAHAREEVENVGRDVIGRIRVLDAGSEEEATVMVAWGMVAVAVVLDSPQGGGRESTGQYA